MNWKEEENLFKNVYDEYKWIYKDGVKFGKLLGCCEWEWDCEEKRVRREDLSCDEVCVYKWNFFSFLCDVDRKKLFYKIMSFKECWRLELGCYVKDDWIFFVYIFDCEILFVVFYKVVKLKNCDIDVVVFLDGEVFKLRRKFVLKGEFCGERDKYCCFSMVLNVFLLKEFFSL